MRKLKDILFKPDDYDGLTWFDVICAWTLSAGIFTGLVFLIRAFCQELVTEILDQEKKPIY